MPSSAAAWRTSSRGRGSGVEVDEPYVFLVALRNDEVLEVHEYRTKEEALEAAG